jgi:hypothetical protein
VRSRFQKFDRPFNPDCESTPNFLRKSQNFFSCLQAQPKSVLFYRKLGCELKKTTFFAKILITARKFSKKLSYESHQAPMSETGFLAHSLHQNRDFRQKPGCSLG